MTAPSQAPKPLSLREQIAGGAFGVAFATFLMCNAITFTPEARASVSAVGFKAALLALIGDARAWKSAVLMLVYFGVSLWFCFGSRR